MSDVVRFPFEPDDVYTIDSLEKLRVVSNPLRMRILDCLIPQARTIKDVGDILEVRSNTLYYHASELETAGLIKLVDTPVKSGIQQKYYRASARYFLLQSSLLHRDASDGEVDPGLAFITGAIERSADELRRSFRHGLIDEWIDTMRVSRRVIRMSPERAVEFRQRLEELEAAFVALDDDTGELSIEYQFALFPHYDPDSSGRKT